MNDTAMKQKIENSIQAFEKPGVSEAALRLFQTLGYNTSRQNPFTQKTFQAFKESFLEGDTCSDAKKARVDDWSSVDPLFQLSSHRMAG